MIVAAISQRAAPELAFVGVGIVLLIGAWLLLDSSARKSTVARRGGARIARRRRPAELADVGLARSRWGETLGKRLRLAGSKRSPGEFVLIVQLLVPLLLAIVAAVLAANGCFSWLSRRIEKRKEEFVGQLPEVTRLLGNGAQAGLSMPAALELTVREIEDPARTELRSVIDELTFGRSLDDALADMQRRLPSREVAVLLTTLIIQQRSGGDVVHALHELSGTLEQRRNTLREVSTLLAGAVYTSYLVPLLGVGSLLLLNTINSKILHDLTTQALGIVVLILAGGMYAVGWVLIRRTTRIDL